MKRKSQVRTTNPGTSLSSLSLAHGKRARLWRLLYGHGPGNGTLMVLPLDQGLEHGPTDFFPNPAALDTTSSSAWPSRVASRRSPSESASPRSTCGTTRAHPPHPEAQRQDEHRRRRRGRVARFRERRGRGAPGGGRGRLHGLRGIAAAGRRDPRVRQGPAGVRALRHAPRGVGLPARPRHRGQGRQGHALRPGLRGAGRGGARTRTS